MTALWRINLWVTLFFALVALLGTALLLRQGSADVQREMRAAEAMIEYLQVAAQCDPASLLAWLASLLRIAWAVRRGLRVLDGPLAGLARGGPGVPRAACGPGWPACSALPGPCAVACVCWTGCSRVWRG